MSMKANPAKIGAFVVGGLVLIVLAVVCFGSGGLFSNRVPLIMYFSDSVTGLTEFIKSVGRIDIAGISSKLDSTLTQLNELVGQLQVKQMSEGVVKVLDSTDKLINSSGLKDAIISLGKTSEETRKVLTRLD